MKKFKFLVTLYSPSEEHLRQTLVSKGILPEKIERATKTKKQKLIDTLNLYTCPVDDYTTEQTADAVLRALKASPDKFIDDVFINKKDEDSKVTMVQHMEYQFSVKEICNMAGL